MNLEMTSRRLASLLLTLFLLTGLAAAGEPEARLAPALPDQQWLNTPGNKPLKIEDLRGKVVLVEFWAFG